MMIASERKNNRGKIQIMGDVLALGTSGIVYRTTEKGREFLLYYTRLVEFLEEEEKQEPEVEPSSPFISSRSWVR
jgi:predicted transcriptional regulator